MLVRKDLMAEMRILVLITAMSLSLSGQGLADRPPVDLDSALATGQLEQVQLALDKLLARPHLELEVILETGSKLAERELFQPASTIFARGVRDYPQNFEARYNLALADFALQQFSGAQTTLEGARNLSKDQQVAREYLRGKIHDGLGETDEAEKSLETAVRAAPQQENYSLDLGLHYLRRHLYAKALKTLSAAAQYHPDSTYLQLELAVAQVLGDDPLRAIDTCRKLVVKEPTFGPARLLLVMAFYLNGDNQICVTETEQAVRQPGAPPFLYYLHAASLLKLNSKEYTVMLHDLDAANGQIPGCAFCYFALSKVHQEMGQDAAAIADLETLVTRVDPEFSQGWYRLGNLYRRAGRVEDATRALEKCRTIKNEQSTHELEYLQKLFVPAPGSGQSAR